MAKVFIILLSALVVLNGMTFLVVVNQGTAPGQGASSQADAAAKKPGPDPALQKLESLERVVQGVKGSMDRLSSKVDGLQTKVNQVASRSSIAPAATEPLPPASATKRPVSGAQRGRIDYSRITTPQAQPAQPAADEETNDEGAATAETQPAAQPAEGAPAEGTAPAEGAAAEGAAAEGAAGQTPAPEGAEGITPGETTPGEDG